MQIVKVTMYYNHKIKQVVMLIALSVWLPACYFDNKPSGEINGKEQEGTGSVVPVAKKDSIPKKEKEVTQVTLTAIGNTETDMGFEPDTIVIPAKGLVQLTLHNNGAEPPMMHNVVITKAGTYKKVALLGIKVGPSEQYVPELEEIIVATPLAKPLQTVKVEFPAPPPGEYDYVCTYPDHYVRMHGKLFVQ